MGSLGARNRSGTMMVSQGLPSQGGRAGQQGVVRAEFRLGYPFAVDGANVESRPAFQLPTYLNYDVSLSSGRRERSCAVREGARRMSSQGVSNAELKGREAKLVRPGG